MVRKRRRFLTREQLEQLEEIWDKDIRYRIEKGRGKEMREVLELYHEILKELENIEYILLMGDDREFKELASRFEQMSVRRIIDSLRGYPRRETLSGTPWGRKWVSQQREKGETGSLSLLSMYVEELGQGYGAITEMTSSILIDRLSSFNDKITDYDRELIRFNELREAYRDIIKPEKTLALIRDDIVKWNIIHTYEEMEAWDINENLVLEILDILENAIIREERRGLTTAQRYREIKDKIDDIRVAIDENKNIDYYQKMYDLVRLFDMELDTLIREVLDI